MEIPTNLNEERLQSLVQFPIGIMNGENGKELIGKHREAIDQMTPYDMLNMENYQMKMGISIGEIKKSIDKVINVFYESLKSYSWEKPSENTFLYTMKLENDAYKYKLNKVKNILKSYNKRDESEKGKIFIELMFFFESFLEFDAHYVKKETILFPLLEKNWNNHNPLKVMWSLHDEIRKKLKSIISLLNDKNPLWMNVAKEIGSFYFLVFGMFQKENLVLYPIVSETLTHADKQALYDQSFANPFPFIDPPKKTMLKNTTENSIDPNFVLNKEGFFDFSTGQLNLELLEMVMNLLPLDITVVDENDKVIYYSNPPERIFPRSPAIIGRDVKNCHPPESVAIVEKIVDSFKRGLKKEAKFWLQLGNKFICISYYPLLNNQGEYKGVLEISQEISELKALEGEKRLLDWE